jgi:hypothetical protein
MEVTLQEHDRILVVFNAEGDLTDKDGANLSTVAIAFDTDSDFYVVIHRGKDGPWHLGWRGELDSVMKYFDGLVGDLMVEISDTAFVHTA